MNEILIEALAGMLAIERSVTQGQERECRKYWVSRAESALQAAGVDVHAAVRDATKKAERGV